MEGVDGWREGLAYMAPGFDYDGKVSHPLVLVVDGTLFVDTTMGAKRALDCAYWDKMLVAAIKFDDHYVAHEAGNLADRDMLIGRARSPKKTMRGTNSMMPTWYLG